MERNYKIETKSNKNLIYGGIVILIINILWFNPFSEIEKATSQNWNKIVDEKKDKEDIIKVSIDTQFDSGKVIINVIFIGKDIDNANYISIIYIIAV